MNSWTGVRERVEALAGRDVFGARRHGFRLAPPLTSDDLAEAESQFGVTLPPEYRSFLLEVGAGGAGPNYGLATLTRSPDGRWSWLPAWNDRPALDTAFAPGDLDSVRARLEQEQPDEDSPEYADWYENWDDPMREPRRTAGGICLSDEGCAYYTWLAVSGPDAGTIWRDARSVDIDLYRDTAPDGAPLTFRAWYLTWLTRAEAAAHPR